MPNKLSSQQPFCSLSSPHTASRLGDGLRMARSKKKPEKKKGLNAPPHKVSNDSGTPQRGDPPGDKAELHGTEHAEDPTMEQEELVGLDASDRPSRQLFDNPAKVDENSEPLHLWGQWMRRWHSERKQTHSPHCRSHQHSSATRPSFAKMHIGVKSHLLADVRSHQPRMELRVNRLMMTCARYSTQPLTPWTQ